MYDKRLLYLVIVRSAELTCNESSQLEFVHPGNCQKPHLVSMLQMTFFKEAVLFWILLNISFCWVQINTAVEKKNVFYNGFHCISKIVKNRDMSFNSQNHGKPVF